MDTLSQMARNLTDVADGFLRDSGYLIHDRDPLFTAEFRSMLTAAGVKTVRLPLKSPNLNAYAERFVRSMRQECLNRVVPLGEGHLRELVQEFVVHYREERNHQGIGNRLIQPPANVVSIDRPLKKRERPGGLLNYYYREAA